MFHRQYFNVVVDVFKICGDTRKTKTLNPKPCQNSIHNQVPEIITASFISTTNPNQKRHPKKNTEFLQSTQFQQDWPGIQPQTLNPVKITSIAKFLKPSPPYSFTQPVQTNNDTKNKTKTKTKKTEFLQSTQLLQNWPGIQQRDFTEILWLMAVNLRRISHPWQNGRAFDFGGLDCHSSRSHGLRQSDHDALIAGDRHGEPKFLFFSFFF